MVARVRRLLLVGENAQQKLGASGLVVLLYVSLWGGFGRRGRASCFQGQVVVCLGGGKIWGVGKSGYSPSTVDGH